MKRPCDLHLLVFCFLNYHVSSPVKDKVCVGENENIWEVVVEKAIIFSALSLIMSLLIKA